MLTFESLLAQAKSRGMSGTKARGILREYLQVLILKELYKTESGRKLYFTGGTYLRLLHNFKRFSEDLDFNTADIKKTEFEKLLMTVNKELVRVGIESTVRFSHWRNILVSKLIFTAIEKQYGVVSRHSKKEGIAIKIETNQPGRKLKTETEVISGFGEIYPCLCTDRSFLFADKIDALTKKNRGRHIYDVIFMLSNRFPIDRFALNALGKKQEPLDIIHDRIKGYSKAELKKQADILRPFLFDEAEADLVANAAEVIPQLIKRYRS